MTLQSRQYHETEKEFHAMRANECTERADREFHERQFTRHCGALARIERNDTRTPLDFTDGR